MSETLNPTVNRRAFLRGTAVVAGAGVLSSSGLAFMADAAVVSVAFIEGDRLIPANWLASEPAFDRAELTIEAIGEGVLRGLTANFPIKSRTGSRSIAPFNAWVASGGRARFEMPVGRNGISLTISQSAGTTSLPIGPGNPIKMREGTYVIAAGNVNWRGLRVENGQILGAGGAPSTLPHLRLSIARA